MQGWKKIASATDDEKASFYVAKKIVAIAWKHSRWNLILSIIFSLSRSALNVYLPLALANLYKATLAEEGQDRQNHFFNEAYKNLWWVIGVGFVGMCTFYPRKICLTKLTADISAHIWLSLIPQLTDADREETQKIDIKSIRVNIYGVLQTLFGPIPLLFEIITDCAVLAKYYKYWALLPAGGSIAILGINYLLARCLVGDYPARVSRHHEIAMDSLLNRKAEASKQLQQSKNIYIKSERRINFVMIIIIFLISIQMAAITIAISHAAQDSKSKYTVDDLMFVVNYMIAIGWSLSNIGDFRETLQANTSALKNSLTRISSSDDSLKSRGFSSFFPCLKRSIPEEQLPLRVRHTNQGSVQ